MLGKDIFKNRINLEALHTYEKYKVYLPIPICIIERSHSISTQDIYLGIIIIIPQYSLIHTYIYKTLYLRTKYIYRWHENEYELLQIGNNVFFLFLLHFPYIYFFFCFVLGIYTGSLYTVRFIYVDLPFC